MRNRKSQTDNGSAAKGTLPSKIPEGWLQDIKNALQESRKRLIITTILGSSLLTGVLGTIGNYLIENHKSDLEWKRHNVARKLESYDALGKDVQQLENKVITARIASRAAAVDSSQMGLAIDQIGQLSNQIAIVQNRVKDQILSGSNGPRTLVETWLDPLAAKIQAVQTSPNKSQALTDLATILEGLQTRGIGELKAKIAADEEALR